jgi:hypothetical protein
MSDEKAFSGSILRVFEARAKPGCADSLAKKFATTSVDVVGNQPGNQGHKRQMPNQVGEERKP